MYISTVFVTDSLYWYSNTWYFMEL